MADKYHEIKKENSARCPIHNISYPAHLGCPRCKGT